MKIKNEFKIKGSELYVPRATFPIECKTCLFDSSIAKIEDDGDCEYCKLQTQLRNQAREPFENIVERIRNAGKNKQYDCLVGISGGEDSSVLLYLAVKVWKLRPLVIHFNNRWNRPEADNNIRVITYALNVNFIEYFVDQEEYNALTDAFLEAGVQDADIPNDIAMAKLMYSASRQYGIKYILNGHDFAHEGSSPSAWSYMDAKYVKSVYKKWAKKEENPSNTGVLHDPSLFPPADGFHMGAGEQA